MSYLDSLRKRASFAIEPYEQPEELAPPVSGGVDAGVPDTLGEPLKGFPTPGGERPKYELPKVEVDTFDPFEAIGTKKFQAEYLSEVASEQGKETLKALRTVGARDYTTPEEDAGVTGGASVLGALQQAYPAFAPVRAVADLVTGTERDVDVKDVYSYFFSPQNTPDDVYESLSASAIDTASPVYAELEKQGRKAKKVREAKELRADVASRKIKRQYIDQYGEGDGKARYDQLLQNIIDQQSTPDKPLTERDAEFVLLAAVEQSLPGEQAAAKAVQSRATNLVLETSDARVERSLWNTAATDLPLVRRGISLISETPGIDRAENLNLVQGAAATGSTLERAELLETMFNLPTQVDVEGVEPVNATLVGSQALSEMIANGTVVFADKDTRRTPKVEDPYLPLKSGVIDNEDDQARVIYLATRAGIPAPMAYAISETESTGSPAAFAYNLHIGSALDKGTPEGRRRTAEQERSLRSRLKAAGIDVAQEPGENGRYPAENFYGQDAQRVFRIAFTENPVAAVQGGAWGEYQVLGRDGGLIDLMREIDGVETDEDAAEQAVVQFSQNAGVIGDELFVRWFQRDTPQARAARQAASEGDVDRLSGLYYGTSSDKDQVEKREKWAASTRGHLDNYVSQMFVPPEPASEQTEKTALTATTTPLSTREDPEDFIEDSLTSVGEALGVSDFREGRSKVEKALGMDAIQASSGSGLIP